MGPEKPWKQKVSEDEQSRPMYRMLCPRIVSMIGKLSKTDILRPEVDVNELYVEDVFSS